MRFKLITTQMAFTVLFCVSSYAYDVHGQDILSKRITLNVETEKVKTVLKQIESQTHIKFIFSSNVIQSNATISVHAENESVKTVLDKILPPLRISYKVADTRILLSKKEVKLTPSRRVPLQNINITGIIKDEKGEPVIGATVSIKGTSIGTVTDSKGEFRRV